jgi:putative membrane protein
MKLRSAAAFAAGCLALLWILYSVGFAVILRDIAWAGWILPVMAAVHLGQLYLSALAWRLSLGGAGLTRRSIFFARWVREGVNALLPVAQIGGQLAGAGILVRRGVPPSLAAAGTILDLTLEAAAQIVFVLAGMGVLLGGHGNRAWLGWVGGGVVLTTLGLTGFVAAQRLGLLRMIENFLERMARHWPAMANWSMEGLHANMLRRQADHGAILRALVLHSFSWALGSVEVAVALRALGHPVSARDSFVIESLAMAARSAGFAVPGAVGVQEGGFVLVCGLFGVPAEVALALSVLKRLREILVGVPALLQRKR